MVKNLPKAEVIQEIYRYISPNVLSNDFIKQILALQMFINPMNGEMLHLIIAGGTGVAKTEIAKDLVKVIPNGVYVGKETTAVGLSEKILMARFGVVFADEFDKWGSGTRRVLLEPMQDGTLTVDKHRRHYSYDISCNVCALCNPVSGELLEGYPIVPQLSFSNDYPLMARFHLIVPIYAVDTILYPDIAVGMANKREDDERRRRMMEILIKVKQEIPDVEVDNRIAREIGYFVKNIKETSPVREIVTPRLIEGVISCVKARARMSIKDKASMEDLNYVKNVVGRVYL